MGSFYQRIDTLKIKDELKKRISDENYWILLKSYLNGKTKHEIFEDSIVKYLDDDRSRHLHNQLIKAILYNAHFSRVPPPGITLPRIIKSRSESGSDSTSNRFNQSCDYVPMIRCIPSLSDLSQTIKEAFIKSSLEVDDEAILSIYNEMHVFLTNLLRESIINSFRNKSGNICINKNSLITAIETSVLKSMISKHIFSKYQD